MLGVGVQESEYMREQHDLKMTGRSKLTVTD